LIDWDAREEGSGGGGEATLLLLFGIAREASTVLPLCHKIKKLIKLNF